MQESNHILIEVKLGRSAVLIFGVMIIHSMRVWLHAIARAMSSDCVDLSPPPSIKT
jgi:hypothetical protein